MGRFLHVFHNAYAIYRICDLVRMRYITYAIQCSMKMCNLHLSRYDEDEGEGVDDDEDEGVDDGEDEADEQ